MPTSACKQAHGIPDRCLTCPCSRKFHRFPRSLFQHFIALTDKIFFPISNLNLPCGKLNRLQHLLHAMVTKTDWSPSYSGEPLNCLKAASVTPFHLLFFFPQRSQKPTSFHLHSCVTVSIAFSFAFCLLHWPLANVTTFKIFFALKKKPQNLIFIYIEFFSSVQCSALLAVISGVFFQCIQITLNFKSCPQEALQSFQMGVLQKLSTFCLILHERQCNGTVHADAVGKMQPT